MFEILIAKIIGNTIKKKLNLEEGIMPTKPWYKSVTIWSDIVTILVGTYATAQTTLAPHLGVNLPNIPGWVLAFLGALGVYGRSTATTTIGSPVS